MSQRPASKTSREQLRAPRSKTSKPSIASAKGSAVSKPSAISTRGSTISAKPSSTPAKKEVKEWDLPALSLTYKPKVTESELEKLKKKTIRRNAPPGEDLKQIREILKSIKGQNISVQEFISLIGPSTGDQGETLRKVMNDDLNAFRKLARKVYETITKDNSDVLMNQQLQLTEFYKDRKILLHDKMMRYINEIYAMAPQFDFERYAKEEEKYLDEVLPIPEELVVEPEEIEMMKRQAAYHRLQWLRSEGERLNEENNSLKKRLNQMKRMHKEEQERMLELEREAEAKKDALEQTQANKVEELEKLNESLEKSIISKEKQMRIEKDKILLEPVKPQKKAAKKKSKGAIKKRRPPWNEEAAKEIEATALDEREKAETAKVRSPFHFSPIKTPPRSAQAPREKSPFHFSPIKTPPQRSQARPASPFHYSPPKSPPRPTQAPPSAPRPVQTPVETPRFYGRRAQGPTDTWGGFY